MVNLADNLTMFNGSVISPSYLIMHVAWLYGNQKVLLVNGIGSTTWTLYVDAQN